MKEFKQLGAYGLVIQDDKILLIKKFGKTRRCFEKRANGRSWYRGS